jgi:anionic cell wall polymer biosynthesis LytR-Cps2A-Psr (LCP) family protein
MSIELKVSSINDSRFQQVLQKIASQKVSFGTAYRLRNMFKKIDNARTEITKSYMEMVKNHVELDENGEIIPDTWKEDIKDDEGNIIYTKGTPIPQSYVIKEGHKEKFNEEVAKFMEELIPIEAAKIEYEKLENIELSAIEVDVLEPVIEWPKEALDNVIPLK